MKYQNFILYSVAKQLEVCQCVRNMQTICGNVKTFRVLFLSYDFDMLKIHPSSPCVMHNSEIIVLSTTYKAQNIYLICGTMLQVQQRRYLTKLCTKQHITEQNNNILFKFRNAKTLLQSPFQLKVIFYPRTFDYSHHFNQKRHFNIEHSIKVIS